MPAPDLSTVPAFYHNYILRIKEDNLQSAIDNHLRVLLSMLRNCTDGNWDYAYDVGKWTLKELVQHIIDAERFFCHRALCIARLDPNPLPGFDENAFVENSFARSRSGASLLKELETLNQSTISLFESFSERQLSSSGIANNAPISVNAIGYIICGHALHHANIIAERYLTQ